MKIKETLEEIKWKFKWWKLKLTCASFDRKTKHLRRKYCRYGIHKIHSGSLTVQQSGKRKIHIRYLRCVFCKWLFFAKKSDKDRYNLIQKGDTERLKKVFSALSKCSSNSQPKH